MICAWKELISILPMGLRNAVDKQEHAVLQELRLRVGKPVQMIRAKGEITLSDPVNDGDLRFVINTASRYSPWAAASMARGCLTAPGGHRIGLCGEAVIKDSEITGFRNVTSLCVRVARDFPGISSKLLGLKGNILILGPPGCGKTTVLRDLIRQISNQNGESVAVVDERGELFPIVCQMPCFEPGVHTDILTGYSKAEGVEMAIRTMGPTCVAVDEVTSDRDSEALLQAGWCGVRVLATAHGGSLKDLCARPIYQKLVKTGLFDWLVVMGRDKSYRPERMER